MSTLDQFGKPKPKPEDEPKKEEPKLKEPTSPLSAQDAYLFERLKAQPSTLGEVDVKVEPKVQPNKHRLSLPEELEPYTKKYTFRWIYKTKRAIDEACDVRGWVLVSRLYFPDMPNHLWAISGTMERGDSVLGFMPRARADRLRREPGEESTERIKSSLAKHKGDPKYYKPKDSETGSQVVMI
jgi:hypothetical protein